MWFYILCILQAERSELISQVKALRDNDRQFRSALDEKRKEIEPLQQALGKLRANNNGGRGGGLCSSEEELNDMVCYDNRSLFNAESITSYCLPSTKTYSLFINGCRSMA